MYLPNQVLEFRLAMVRCSSTSCASFHASTRSRCPRCRRGQYTSGSGYTRFLQLLMQGLYSSWYFIYTPSSVICLFVLLVWSPGIAMQVYMTRSNRFSLSAIPAWVQEYNKNLSGFALTRAGRGSCLLALRIIAGKASSAFNTSWLLTMTIRSHTPPQSEPVGTQTNWIQFRQIESAFVVAIRANNDEPIIAFEQPQFPNAFLQKIPSHELNCSRTRGESLDACKDT